MAKERQNWTNNPAMMIRCARHYEGAAQICIRRAVATARKVRDVYGMGKIKGVVTQLLIVHPFERRFRQTIGQYLVRRRMCSSDRFIWRMDRHTADCV